MIEAIFLRDRGPHKYILTLDVATNTSQTPRELYLEAACLN